MPIPIPNATAVSAITPGNVNGSGWNITNLSNEDGQGVTYLQNIENSPSVEDTKFDDNTPNFEVDSIELATPELFSNDNENMPEPNNNIVNEPSIFENNSNNENEIKEQEMFEDTNQEEDFEIPAFLRNQKN